jgi:hypothetical protein
VPVVYFILFYLSWKSSEKFRKEWAFYSIPLIMSILFFTRIAAFIPFMNRPIPDTYNLYFIFLSLFMLFNLKIDNLPKLIKKGIFIGLVIIPILGVLISVNVTSSFPVYGDIENEMVSIVPLINGNFIIFGLGDEKIYSKAVYSYAAVKYNLITPMGSGGGAESVSLDYMAKLGKIRQTIDNKNCEGFFERLESFNVTDVVAYGGECEEIKKCGLKEKVKKEHICLLQV